MKKVFLVIIDHSMPYLLILCITTIIPISKGMSIIVFTLLSILTFIFLYTRHAYDISIFRLENIKNDAS